MAKKIKRSLLLEDRNVKKALEDALMRKGLWNVKRNAPNYDDLFRETGVKSSKVRLYFGFAYEGGAYKGTYLNEWELMRLLSHCGLRVVVSIQLAQS